MVLIPLVFALGAWGPSHAWADQRTIRIIEEPVVSQPPPFSSGGTTVVVPRTRIIVEEGRGRNRTKEAQGVRITGKASVIDGDTLRIEGREFHLFGIDAAEPEQRCRLDGVEYPCGAMATARLAELSLGRTIVCEGQEKTRTGELLAVCRVGDRILNEEMVAEGWALAYTKESDLYLPVQERAKRAKSGLWRGEFVRPWLWRLKH